MIFSNQKIEQLDVRLYINYNNVYNQSETWMIKNRTIDTKKFCVENC